MKHIKRKVLKSIEVVKSGAVTSLHQLSASNNQGTINLQTAVPHFLSEDELVQCFFLKIGNKRFAVAEPHISLIYFSNAQGHLEGVLSYREQLKSKAMSDENTDTLNETFAFYSVVTSFVSSLSNSLEAFVNSKIPKDIKLPNPKRRGTFSDKSNILRHWSLKEKIEIVLTEVYDRNFIIDKGHLYDQVKKLIELRNDITHAKADINYEVNYYEKIFNDAFIFNYVNALESAKSLINYYEPNLIEPCNCGKTH